MKIAVMGAGAVGCYYGGMLARAGHDVTLIGRPAHVAAMQHAGLRLHTLAFDEQVPVHASTEAAAVQGAELVLVCVKATDTESAAAQLRPHLSPQARVWSLQNGVDNAARLADLLQRPVTAAVVYVATEMAGPGHVRHHGRGELLIGAQPDGTALVELFAQAGVPVQVSDQVASALWTKLIINCAYNALSAIGQQPYGVMLQGVGVPEVMRDVVAECLAVAQAEGIALPADLPARVAHIADSMPTQSSSTAQDLRAGRRSEIDHLNGYVVRRGQALGVPTPVNRVLHTLVKLLETRPG
ncbi:MAG TPA: 2-dehydropantoate 2-reductase [Macromonas sp.]|nr:2-dehydropantoate 2-reductase [Macromonas sp.]